MKPLHLPRSRFLSPRRRAVALLMAVSVLAALVAISVPFLLSMILHGRTARVDLSAAQAQAGAEGAVAHGIAHLYRNLLKAPGYDQSLDIDTVSELQTQIALPTLDVANPYGHIWSCKIEDEQGKINLNTAPPNLIGNLLGSTLLTEPVDKDASALTVLNAGIFPTDGDPETVDGLIRVGADTVPYTLVKGSTIYLAPKPVPEPFSFRGFSITRHYAKGSLVYDGRATRITSYRFMPGTTTFRVFRSIYEFKIAADTPLDADAVQNQFPWGIRPDEFAQIERYITAHSGRDGPAWGKAIIYPHSLNGLTKGFGGLEANQGFGPGTVVRFLQNGSLRTANRIERTQLRGDKMNFGLERMLGVDIDVTDTGSGSSAGNEIQIEPELRHPVNINTAPAEVIQACITGVGPRGDTDVVNPEMAQNIAQYLTQKTYQTLEEFQLALKGAHDRGLVTHALAEAIFINASEPNSTRIRGNTVPFCFRSYNSFTVEGSAVVNAENGVPLARSTLREIVTLPTPQTKALELKTQEQFEKLLDQGMARKVVTWPEPLDPPTIKRGQQSNRRKPDPDHGSVRLAVGQVGEHGGYAMDEWIEHCDNPQDKGFFQEGYDLTHRSGWRLDPPASRSGFMPATGVEMWIRPLSNGAMTLFDSGASVDQNRVQFFYDPSREAWVVKIWDANMEKRFVEYIWPYSMVNGEWQHIAASWRSSLPGGQEVRVDANPLPRIKPGWFEPATVLQGKLDLKEFRTLSVEDATVGQLPPNGGAVRIGEEIIEYDSLAGNSLRDLRRGARMTCAVDHLEGETVLPYGFACALSQDLPVGGGTLSEELKINVQTRIDFASPPEATNFILDDETAKLKVISTANFPSSGFIEVGGELIYYGKTTATTFEKLQRAYKVNGLAHKARNLNHNSRVYLCSIQVSQVSQYDPSGMVQIDDNSNNQLVEWIRYGSRETVNGKHYLVAQMGRNGGITIRQGNPPTNLFPETNVYISEFRAQLGTGERNHDAGAKVIPVARMSGPQCGDQWMKCGLGISDVSVVTRGQPGGDQRWIKRAYVEQRDDINNWRLNYDKSGKLIGATWIDWNTFIYWAGLDDFVSRRHPAGSGRFLKFPSGELPDIPSPRLVCLSMDGGGAPEIQVDELKVLSLPTRAAKIAWDESKGLNYGLASGDTEVLIEAPEAWTKPNGAGTQFDPGWNIGKQAGFIRIGDEFMSFQGIQQSQITYHADVYISLDEEKDLKSEGKMNHRARNPVTKALEIHPNNNDERRTVWRLTNLKRGLLNTTPVDYAPGEGVMLYDAAPFTTLSGSVNDSFEVLDSKGFLAEEGYAWVNNEVLGWYKRSGQRFIVDRFRARFGTSEGGHQTGDLIRCLPFRYWDRYAPTYDRDGLAFLQAGQSVSNAIWKEISVECGSGTFGHNPKPVIPPNCRPRILVRFGGQPRWDENPTNQPGGIYQFTGHSGTNNVFKFSGRGVVSDQIELRIYWNYVNGAFQDGKGEDWKRCFGVNKVTATCLSPMVVRRVDEIERR